MRTKRGWRSGVVSRAGPNASAEVIASQPEYWSLSNSKRKFFSKRMAGMLVLQKLEKALVHSGDVTMNVSLRWEKVIVFKSWFSKGVMSLKRQGDWLRVRRPEFGAGCRRGGDFLHFFVSRLLLGSTQPTIKRVPGVNAAERRTSYSNFS